MKILWIELDEEDKKLLKGLFFIILLILAYTLGSYAQKFKECGF